MDDFMYVAMSGAKELMQRQNLVANNLANVNTPGFRADQTALRALPVFNLNLPTRAYVTNEQIHADLSQGPMMQTGRDLDVAISGAGWIAVQGSEGRDAYTRNGNLHVSPAGGLETAAGQPVLGNNGPISLPPLQSVSIAPDGTLSGVPQGQPATAVVTFDRIRLVNPPEQSLQKGEDGLFHSATPAPADAAVSLTAGFLEGSNVSPVSAMVDMISMSRQFETQIKLIQTSREDARKAAQILNIAS